jgi:cation diffusion facilitator family transporter
MDNESIAKYQHTHIFGQDQIKSGERRTLFVIIMTGVMMVVAIASGIIFGSMALLSEGIHMGSHMVGLGITFMAYILARKYAHDQRFSFGTGKMNAFAAYTSAMILILIALLMGYESIVRIIYPVAIAYNQALVIATVGLIVNGASMLILGEKGHTHAHGDESFSAHDHGAHDHGHDHGDHEHADHEHGDHEHGDHEHAHTGTGEDHNLKAAYLHVLTDAVTSLLAIFALLVAKYFHLVWMDPAMGIVGAIMVTRWSFGLIKGTTKILLDQQIAPAVIERITGIFESYKDTQVCDLHVWSIGPGIYSAEIGIITKYPDSPNKYKTLFPPDTGIVHSTVEVHQPTA